MQATFRPKIEILDDTDSEDDEDDSDADSDPEAEQITKTAFAAAAKPKIQLIEETGIVGGEVKQTSQDLMDGLGKIFSSPHSRTGKIDFSQEEEKYANMSKEEKIQDCAENVGSTAGSVMQNRDIWMPEDELD